MANLGVKLEGVSIVLLGSFNPKIFQPLWFASENMISKQEAESAEISVLHPEISSFTMNSIRFEVTRDRFIVLSEYAPSFRVMRDIVLGAFGLLHHTPVHSLGLNHDFHFLLESEDEWHQFGHKIAPKEIWSGILEKAGTQKLIMEGIRTDSRKGYIRYEVSPSVRVHPGVFISVNDHYQVGDQNSLANCQEIIDTLKSNWDTSIEKSKENTFKLLERK